jgi:hypothetical protein
MKERERERVRVDFPIKNYERIKFLFGKIFFFISWCGEWNKRKH